MDGEGPQAAGTHAGAERSGVELQESPGSRRVPGAARRSARVAALMGLGMAAVAAAALARSAPYGGGVSQGSVDVVGVVRVVERGMLAVGAVLAVAVVIGLVWVKAHIGADPSDRSTARQLKAVASFVLTMYLLTVVLGIVLPRLFPGIDGDAAGVGPETEAATGLPEAGAAWPVVVVLIAATASLAAWWRLREGDDAAPGTVAAPARRALVAAAARTADGAPVEEVVISAYAQMEAVFAAAGHPRGTTETTGGFVERILALQMADPGPLVELTRVYERVRFGPDGASAADRRAAVDALRRTIVGLPHG